MRDDFMVGFRRRALVERSHHVDSDMIAPRCAPVKIDSKQPCGFDEVDIAFFAQLTRQGGCKRFTRFDAATRQMPPGDIRVFHQEYPAIAADNDRTHPDSQSTGESPIKMQEPPDERLELLAKSVKVHAEFATVS